MQRLVGAANALGGQARAFSCSRVLLWDSRDVPKKLIPNFAPWQILRQQNMMAESRFRLVGPTWGQVLVHKTHGMRQRYRFNSYDWRAKGRWRRLNENFERKYHKNLLPRGVGNERWTSLYSKSLHQEGIC
ncbi:hypothetical protein DIPPA_04271 [Diplonema papillatum]|nr:hypothetical protein DIPPA_04271 [Diplonema papillatum]|eukprot:gene11190-17208_t